ncbi:MAG TPA: FGGY family carbohydrate kinase, partial [Candidatus Limnocylindrales bacterium]
MSSDVGELILAIDLGTSEAKAGLVGLDGRLVGLARAGYPTERPAAGLAEQDPDAWWAAIVSSTQQLLEEAGCLPGAVGGPRVVAICCVGQGPTLVPTAADGRATGPAVTWLDGRSAAEVDELSAMTGRFSWELGVLPAALHLERRDPSALGGVRWYLNAWEAIACRMTGVAAE